jgi:hypothetical protein
VGSSAHLVTALIERPLVSAPQEKQYGTLSVYDNTSDDDKNPGSFMEYEHITREFLDHVPVVSIDLKSGDWKKYKYHNIDITYVDPMHEPLSQGGSSGPDFHWVNRRWKGKTRTVQAWDACSDDDCGACFAHGLPCCSAAA